MSEFEVWIYRGSIAILLIVLWYLAKEVLQQLKEMNKNIKELGEKFLVHDGRLDRIQDKVTTHETRINDHGERIREVERVQDTCLKKG